MIWQVSLLLALLPLFGGAVTVDRVAVIVGRRVIKTSDISRDLRITEFLNREAPDMSLAAKRQAAERLIDQEIIRQEISAGGYGSAPEADAEATLGALLRDRFAGSNERMRAELSRRGISEDELRSRLLWQLTVLRFIEDRFRPGVQVSDEDVRSYYDQHQAESTTSGSGSNTFEALEAKIRESLEGERINKSFEEWLKEARGRNRIDYRQGAFE